MAEQKQPFHLISGAADPKAAASELARLRSEIEARNRQEVAIAEFGPIPTSSWAKPAP